MDRASVFGLDGFVVEVGADLFGAMCLPPRYLGGYPVKTLMSVGKCGKSRVIRGKSIGRSFVVVGRVVMSIVRSGKSLVGSTGARVTFAKVVVKAVKWVATWAGRVFRFESIRP